MNNKLKNLIAFFISLILVIASFSISFADTTSYSISIGNTSACTIALDSTKALEGAKVAFTITPFPGYTVESVTVRDVKGKFITVDNYAANEYSFEMPASEVIVSAKYVIGVIKTITPTFADVSSTDHFYNSVIWAALNGIASGTDETHFSPAKACTRAETVTFMYRAAGSPNVEPSKSFSDVASGSYYEKAVSWAVANGITSGTDETHFSPAKVCTRAETLTFLYRLADSPNVELKKSFSDVESGSFYENAVAWACKNDITKGMTETTFDPYSSCTRAQIVTLLYRYFN